MQFGIVRGEPQYAAAKWKQQYFRKGEWGSTISGNAKDTYDRLAALGDKPTRDAVEAIARGWASCFCSCCKDYVGLAVGLDAGDGCAYICLPCLETMAFALKRASSEDSHG